MDLCEGGRGWGGGGGGVQPAEDPKGEVDWSGKDASGGHEQSECDAMLLRASEGPGTTTSLTDSDRASSQARLASLCSGGQVQEEQDATLSDSKLHQPRLRQLSHTVREQQGRTVSTSWPSSSTSPRGKETSGAKTRVQESGPKPSTLPNEKADRRRSSPFKSRTQLDDGELPRHESQPAGGRRHGLRADAVSTTKNQRSDHEW